MNFGFDNRITGYDKNLERVRCELAEKLATAEPGSAEYKNIADALKSVDSVLNQESNTKINAIKIVGTLLLGCVGLGLAHASDIGDSIPGKLVSKIVDTLVFKKL